MKIQSVYVGERLYGTYHADTERDRDIVEELVRNLREVTTKTVVVKEDVY